MIKKILSVLCTAVVMLSLVITVTAQEGYSITFPEDDFKKVSENEYYTDNFYVNDVQYRVTAKITVEDFDDSFDPYSDEHLKALAEEIETNITDQGYLSVHFSKEPTVVKITPEHYHCINIQYSAHFPGERISHGFINYRIYTPEKLYNIMFYSKSGFITMSEMDDNIVNTLRIDNYSKATGAKAVTVPEPDPAPIQPSVDDTSADLSDTAPSEDNSINNDTETESSSKNGAIADSDRSTPITVILGIIAAIIVGIIILVYFISMSAKKKSARNMQTHQSGNYRTAHGTTPTDASAKQKPQMTSSFEKRSETQNDSGKNYVNNTPEPKTQDSLANNTANNTDNATASPINNTLLDDVTYIRDIKQSSQGIWYKYDILIAARPYGWDYMVDSADYMAKADLEALSQLISSTELVENGDDLISHYRENGNNIKGIAELEKEGAMLSAAGLSRALKAPMKILWFNQTNALAFYTFSNDITLIRRYAESVIRRNFGTADEMKEGKPINS